MFNLTAQQRRIVIIGCNSLMLTIAAFGLSLATIQGPVLASLNGDSYYSLLTLWSSIAMCVMTPIGGRLIDMIGSRKLLIFAGGLSIISALAMAFIPNVWSFMIFRIILALCMGSYSSVAYILIQQTYPSNEAPKQMGYLAITLAIGGVAGSYFAGWLVDNNMMTVAIVFPVVFIAIAMFCICTRIPNVSSGNLHLDWLGIILLVACLTGLLMALNNGGTEGWYSTSVLTEFAVGLIALIIFIWWENKAAVPLIPMQLFRIKEYTILLIIGFCLLFYSTASSFYLPLAVQDMLQAGTSASGALQFPRALATIILPGFVGAWIVKKTANMWIAMATGCLFLVIPFGLLIFTGVHMPLWFMMVMMFLIGISEAFRSVALTPAAQALLKPTDIGIGTSLVGFTMTLAGSVSAAIDGMAYGSLTAATPGLRGMTDGIDTICLITFVVALAGLLLTVMFFRPAYEKAVAKKKAAAEAAAKAKA